MLLYNYAHRMYANLIDLTIESSDDSHSEIDELPNAVISLEPSSYSRSVNKVSLCRPQDYDSSSLMAIAYCCNACLCL